MVAGHEVLGVSHAVLGLEREGVGDDSGLGTFYAVDLAGLLFDAEVLVDDADAAFLGKRDGEAGFGDGVHARADDGYAERDVAREEGREIHLAGQDIGAGGLEEDVVEGEAL